MTVVTGLPLTSWTTSPSRRPASAAAEIEQMGRRAYVIQADFDDTR